MPSRLTWVVEQSKELRQIIVHGQGEFHLRTLKWRMENNEKIQIEYIEPKIPYRETITKMARADYRHKKQSGGAGQFGEVHLIVEPYTEGMPDPTSFKINGQEFKMNIKGKEEITLDWGGKLVFINSVVGLLVVLLICASCLLSLRVSWSVWSRDLSQVLTPATFA